mmetsp:Transcript_82587/g.168316  ORF Transcript_82587/g.168316 Transcript_82587/m.168316 type:complete len:155 (+) Transcript_82587:54-518(+)
MMSLLRCRAVCRTASLGLRGFSGGPSAEAIAAIQANFKKNPAQAQASFSSSSELMEGLVSNGQLRNFPIKADEPESFGGKDSAPNPVEILLFSLGACQEITTKAFANAMGVPLTRVSVELTGHIDLRGFFAVDSIRLRAPLQWSRLLTLRPFSS